MSVVTTTDSNISVNVKINNLFLNCQILIIDFPIRNIKQFKVQFTEM